MKPIIGIVCDIRESDNYSYSLSQSNVRAVINAGGVPVILPYDTSNIDYYLSVVDGLYLTGGTDIDPFYYNEDPNKNIGVIYPDRDEFEIALCKRAMEKKLPLLGVCRGCQLINIACGGTLYQDLNTEIENHVAHRRAAGTPFSAYIHSVAINESTILYDIYKSKKMLVNSSHHQCIKEVAADFIVSARAKDGIIEAIEHENGSFVLGVQWHPEAMFSVHTEAILIYERFIEECINNSV